MENDIPRKQKPKQHSNILISDKIGYKAKKVTKKITIMINRINSLRRNNNHKHIGLAKNFSWVFP